MEKSLNVNSPGTLTWLQAAEHVLREEGPEMHIRDLTNRILEQSMVKSNCATSLETLLYRHTSGGGNSTAGRGKGGYGSGGGVGGGGGGQQTTAAVGPNSSKFIRVPGKHGWFGLCNPLSLPAEDDAEIESTHTNTANGNHGGQNGMEQDFTFEPKAFYTPALLSQQYSRKRRHSYHSSGGESVSSLSGSDDEMGEMEIDGNGSSEFTSDEEDEESVTDDSLYRKKYIFVKRMAKNIIYENAALANRMVVIKEKINRAQAEKKFLLERLANFEKSKPSKPLLSFVKPLQTLPRLLQAAPGTGPLTPSSLTTTTTTGTVIGGGSAGGVGVSSVGARSVKSGALVAVSVNRGRSKQMTELVPSPAGSGAGSVTTGRTTKESRRAISTTASSTTVSKVSLAKPLQPPPDTMVSIVAAATQQIRDELGKVSSGRRLSGGGEPRWLGGETTGAEVGVRGNQILTKRSILMSESSSSESSDSDSERELSIVQHDHTTKTKGAGKKGGGYQRGMKQDISSEGGSGQLELAMRCGKVRRLHPIALNDDGSPVFPIVVGGLKVNSLGEIIPDRPAYHSERYILPVGFESVRTYPSTLDPSSKCSYTCKILDGGDNPIFEMIPEDDHAHPIRASSSTACQTIVLKKINKARDKQATNSGSGPEFFGYSNPTILNLLQKMPNAKKCPKYKFVRFAEPNAKSRRTGSTSFLGGRRGKGSLKRRGGGLKRGQAASDTLLTGDGHQRDMMASSPSDSSLAIAPVLGTGHQYGMDTMSYSSSNEPSDSELVIDS